MKADSKTLYLPANPTVADLIKLLQKMPSWFPVAAKCPGEQLELTDITVDITNHTVFIFGKQL